MVALTMGFFILTLTKDRGVLTYSIKKIEGLVFIYRMMRKCEVWKIGIGKRGEMGEDQGLGDCWEISFLFF